MDVVRVLLCMTAGCLLGSLILIWLRISENHKYGVCEKSPTLMHEPTKVKQDKGCTCSYCGGTIYYATKTNRWLMIGNE